MAQQLAKEESDPPGDKGNSTREWTGLLSGGVLVLLTAALFGVGRAFRQGYLIQLGVDPGQISEDFHGYLYWGYMGGTPLLLSWMCAAVFAFLGYAALLWLLRAAAGRWVWARQVTDWWNKSPHKKVPPHIGFFALAILTAATIYLVFIIYVAMSQVEKYGVQRGSAVVKNLASPQPRDARWIDIIFDSRVESGYRLLCTDKLCSIYDAAGKTIRIVSLEGMREIRVFESRPR